VCFEIFGFDILLDSSFKPWLLEVNHTPSFKVDTPLDKTIKTHLIWDTLTLVKPSNLKKTKYYRKTKFSVLLNKENNLTRSN
jgi:tubulin polyglutamylase TTLL6/13